MSDTEVTLFQGDCLELMPKIQPGNVAMVFADLPYQCTANVWDVTIDPSAFWCTLKKICTPSAVKILTATQRFASLMITSNQRQFRYDLIWEKTVASGHLNAKNMPMRAHESVLIFYEKKATYNPQMTQGEPYKFTHKTFSTNYGQQNGAPRISHGTRHPRSVLKIKNPNRGKHPTQKPVALLEWLIRTYTNDGDTILDPVAGSGTTAIAAMNVGNRKVICIEKDPTYFEVMSKRVAEHKEKLRQSSAPR